MFFPFRRLGWYVLPIWSSGDGKTTIILHPVEQRFPMDSTRIVKWDPFWWGSNNANLWYVFKWCPLNSRALFGLVSCFMTPVQPFSIMKFHAVNPNAVFLGFFSSQICQKKPWIELLNNPWGRPKQNSWGGRLWETKQVGVKEIIVVLTWTSRDVMHWLLYS